MSISKSGFFPIQKIKVGTGTAYPYTTPCQIGSDAGMYFWDTALRCRRAGKMEKRDCKSCVRLRVTKWIYISQGKHRTWLELRNNNQDVPHAHIPAALHPPWPGSRRRGEDTEQPLPGSLPCRAAVSRAWLLAGSGPLPAPSVSCAGLSPWLISTISIDLLWLPGRLSLPHLILCKVSADDSLIISMYWGKPCSHDFQAALGQCG